LKGRLPVVAALGVRGITSRPLRAALVWVVLLLGVMKAVFALGATATIDRYAHDAALTGVFADVFIRPDLYDPQATPQLIASRPEVAYYYARYEHTGVLADGVSQLDIVFADGDTRRVAATLTSGRWSAASADEIVLGDQAMQHDHLRLGDRIPVTVTLNSGQQVMVTYTILGTLFATQRADEAYAPLSTLTAQAGVTTDDLLPYSGYEVTLCPGISAHAFAQTLQALSWAPICLRAGQPASPWARSCATSSGDYPLTMVGQVWEKVAVHGHWSRSIAIASVPMIPGPVPDFTNQHLIPCRVIPLENRSPLPW
jgi:hypothetical protein